VIHSNDATDVGVVSLDDRRKIRDLEASKADLERRLAEALGRVQPAMERAAHTACYHSGGFVVEDELLQVTCAQCGAICEPYEVLRKIAHREVNFCYTLNSLRTEAERLRAEVEKLKAARSRIRRRVRGQDDVPPAGIAAMMREHRIYQLQLAGDAQAGMAVCSFRAGGKTLRADGVDVEGALVELTRLLGERATIAADEEII
jgi:hypothetical protein